MGRMRWLGWGAAPTSAWGVGAMAATASTDEAREMAFSTNTQVGMPGVGVARSIVAGSCAVLAALALTVGPVGAATASPPARSVLQSQANAIVAAGAPGVSVAVRDEVGTWEGIAGVGDIRTGSRPDSRGRFRIGSITKSFTATMVLQLVAEKRIELDAPVDRYLPGLLPYQEPITVRDLLQHTSGLFEYRDVVWPNSQAVRDGRFRSYSPTQLVHIATEHPLRPDRKFFYSNTDYIVLGMLIEKVTQHSIATELEHRIVRPAGLRHTYLAGAFPVLPHPALRGYEALSGPDGALTDLTTYNMTVSWTTGAIVSTAVDVNRFYRALLTGELLPAAQLRQMQQTIPAFEGFGYGLGLAGGKPCGQWIWGHVGGVPGYTTYSFTSSDAKRQITITVNRSLTLDPAAEKAINTMVFTEFCSSP
jgi:D-alanyl-D-alanine carboxypeptidase